MSNIEHRTDCISILSNIASRQKKTHEELESFAEKGMEVILNESKVVESIGKNKIVWGPVIVSFSLFKKKQVAANTLVVTFNEEDKHYTIGIAGTNFDSCYSWILEDFNTVGTRKWKEISPNSDDDSGKIAAGTFIGLEHLLKMRDSKRENQTLIEFLANIDDKEGLTLSIGGHSLGGTLTPVLATYLLDEFNIWNKEGRFTAVHAYPTAGATPGDSSFAEYVEKKFEDERFTYLGKYNALDIVPHAWDESMLNEIKTIYEPRQKTPELICIEISELIRKTKKNDYRQIKPLKVLNGTFCSSLSNDFLKQAGYQHITAYQSLLGVEKFIECYIKYINSKHKKKV